MFKNLLGDNCVGEVAPPGAAGSDIITVVPMESAVISWDLVGG